MAKISPNYYIGNSGKTLGNLLDYVNVIYPVGSIYLTVENVNPRDLFGGSWTKLSGGYLYCEQNSISNSSYTGKGTQSHRLSASQSGLPWHQHEIQREQNAKASGGNWDWGGPGGYDGGIHSYTSGTGGWDASEGHSHNVAFIGVYCWKRTA